MKRKSYQIFFLSAVILGFPCCFLFASDKVLSDPDHISTGIEYRGVPDARIGDCFSYSFLSAGGLIDIRNETRFNQGLLPNHNWRGFGFINASHTPLENKDVLKIIIGFEHESAHPTMGFNDGNVTAYDKVYDSTYRNINMNSGLFRVNTRYGSKYKVSFTGDMHFYFSSRNTPELPINDLTWSEGMSGGIECMFPVHEKADIYISAFDRYIFQSRKKIQGNIYNDEGSTVITRNETYPIINNVNTISLKSGIILKGLDSDRKVSLYVGFLYGNIYGLVDSREKRKVYSFGIEILH